MRNLHRPSAWRWLALGVLFAAGAGAGLLLFPATGGSRPAICPNPPCVTVPDPTTTTTTPSTTTTTSNGAPTASASVMPNPATVGGSVSFAGSATDPDGDPVTFLWNLGDGSIVGGQFVSHAYASPGSYGVTLAVTDSHGNRTVTGTSVVVNPALSTSTTTTTPVTTTAPPPTTTSGGDDGSATTTTTIAPSPTATTPPTTTSTQESGRCFVPSVRGKTLLNAARAIKARGCTVGKVNRVRARLARNRVVAQKPTAGSLLRRGARVNLVVSRGRR